MMRKQIFLILWAFIAFALVHQALGEEPAALRAVVDNFCLSCHDADTAKGGLNLPFETRERANSLRGARAPPTPRWVCPRRG